MGKPVIICKGICKKFQTAGGTYFYALNNIDLTINKGEFAVIAGPNGAGKSFFALILASLEEADCGSVEVFEEAALVFQNADSQILGETALEDAAIGPRNQGFSRVEAEKLALQALNATGLGDKADFSARFLSGGEKRRLSVAGALAMRRNLIIFDEVFANLDFCGVCEVNKLLMRLKEKGITVLLLTHEIEKVLALADRFIVFFEGSKVFDGTVEDALQKDLERWKIRNPLCSYTKKSDLFWSAKS